MAYGQETREGVFLEPPPPEADRRTAAERRYDEQRAATEAKRVTQVPHTFSISVILLLNLGNTMACSVWQRPSELPWCLGSPMF